MKKYQVRFSERAVKDLKKMDRYTSSLIIGWIEKNLVNCEDPKAHGKALSANLSGIWRYRIGDYRLLAQIKDDELLILLVKIGHRSEVYDS